MIRAMDVYEDLNAMQEMLESAEPLFSEHNQISVTCRPSATDPLSDAIGWLPEGVAEAEHWLTLLHQRLPHNGDIVRTLAATADLRNDTQGALTLYRSLLDLFPKDEEALSYIRAHTGA